MPITRESNSTPRSLKGVAPLIVGGTSFNRDIAGRAIVEGINYLQKRLGWSGNKIAKILHIPPNTLNNWIKIGEIPNLRQALSPDIQLIIHLLAIHRSLEAMFEEPLQQLAWLSTFHPELEVIPEDEMQRSMEGLIFIRRYLDYIRGRGA